MNGLNGHSNCFLRVSSIDLIIILSVFQDRYGQLGAAAAAAAEEDGGAHGGVVHGTGRVHGGNMVDVLEALKALDTVDALDALEVHDALVMLEVHDALCVSTGCTDVQVHWVSVF